MSRRNPEYIGKIDRCPNKNTTMRDRCIWFLACKWYGIRMTRVFDQPKKVNNYCYIGTKVLTHQGRVTHICVSKLTIVGSHNGLSPCRRQWWYIVNWNLKNKLKGNYNRNSNIFIQENAFENLVCEMAAILSRPQCVKKMILSDVNGIQVQHLHTCLSRSTPVCNKYCVIAFH